MRKTQFAAFLLSGLLVLNTAIPAFAEGMTQQRENAQTYAAPDTEAPELKGATLSAKEVKAGENITVTIDAEDDISGIDYCDITFINKKNGRKISDSSSWKNNQLILEVSEYEESGTFEVYSIQMGDKADNYVKYKTEPLFDDDKELKIPLSFNVVNDKKEDTRAPELKGATLSAKEVKAGENITVTIDAEDDISGIDYCDITFINKKNGRKISDSGSWKNNQLILEVSEYEESGTFEVYSIQMGDKADNYVKYKTEPLFDDDKELKIPLSFTVINKDDELVPGESDDELVPGESDEELVPGQSENRPSKPERPSKPNNSGSSSGGIVNYDSEKPDPADKKATEMYNFWQNVKRKIKNTEEGKMLRVAVPAEYTYMPASVMETLRLNPQVSLKLSWGRDTVVIKAGTAQPKQKLKAYWTKSALLKLYTQR